MTTKYTSYEVYTNTLWELYLARYNCQEFLVTTKHQVNKWAVYAYRGGTPGNFHIRIYLADANGKPTGDVIASGDISANAWTTNTAGARYEIPLTTPGTLNADTKYCVIKYCDGSSSANKVGIKGTSSGDGYPDGRFHYSLNSGGSWTEQAGQDAYFEDWGDPVIDPPEATTNPADTITYQSAKLHATLDDDGGEASDMRFNYGKTLAYGTNTAWQENKVTGNQIEQLIESLDDDETYHFRVEAINSGGTVYGADQEFSTLEAPPPEGKQVKVQITHPAIKDVHVYFYDELIGSYENLSDPETGYMESSLEIPVPTPCTIEVITLAEQMFSFQIPLTS